MKCSQCQAEMKLRVLEYRRQSYYNHLELRKYFICEKCNHTAGSYHSMPFNPSHRLCKDIKVYEKDWNKITF